MRRLIRANARKSGMVLIAVLDAQIGE